MLCIVEIAMSVFGIITLVKGSIAFSSSRVVTGAPAYIIGALLTMTLPVIFGLGVVYGALRVMQGGDPTQVPAGAILIDVGVVAIVGVTSAVIAAINGKDPAQVKQAAAAATGLQRPPPDPNNPYAP